MSTKPEIKAWPGGVGTRAAVKGSGTAGQAHMRSHGPTRHACMPRKLLLTPPGTFSHHYNMWTRFAPRAARKMAARPVLQGSFLPRLALLLGVTAASAAVYYAADSRAAVHEYVLCPILRVLTDAETGHRLGITFMKYGILPRLPPQPADPRLAVDVFGTTLDSPVGLAAGLDKDGEAIDTLFGLGFSYVEIGSITPEPQPGNPKPRFFRLPKDEAVINRYGFNSSGHFSVMATLASRLQSALAGNGAPPAHNSLRPSSLLAINLGKNKTGDEVLDYVRGVQRLGPYADVLVINVSSPNTPGLRDLQSEEKLTGLLRAVVKERGAMGPNKLGRQVPVLVKVAPDLTEPELELIAESAKSAKVDGIIVSNTTVLRPQNLLTKSSDLVNQSGGLSGKPLKALSLQALRTLSKHTKDSALVLVGCGGISCGKDALEFGKAGATFVQLYTAFAYKGPGLPAKIRDELSAELRAEGKTWKEIIGQETK